MPRAEMLSQKLMGMASAPGNIVAALGRPVHMVSTGARALRGSPAASCVGREERLTARRQRRGPGTHPRGRLLVWRLLFSHAGWACLTLALATGLCGQQRLLLQGARERRGLPCIRLRQPHGTLCAAITFSERAAMSQILCVPVVAGADGGIGRERMKWLGLVAGAFRPHGRARPRLLQQCVLTHGSCVVLPALQMGM